MKGAVADCESAKSNRGADSSKMEAPAQVGISRGMRSAKSSIVGTSNLTVVGPTTFSALIDDDVRYVDQYISSYGIKGCRMTVDQFLRRVYLELLIPSMDLLPISNTKSSSFDIFYQPDELLHFNSSSSRDGRDGGLLAGSVRTVSLIVSFPAKYASFWYPSLYVEDKSYLEVRATCCAANYAWRDIPCDHLLLPSFLLSLVPSRFHQCCGERVERGLQVLQREGQARRPSLPQQQQLQLQPQALPKDEQR